MGTKDFLKNHEPNRVAVLRALQLGDLMCIVPAMRALKAAYPKAQIVLIGLPWAQTFVARFPQYFDGFLEFPGYPGMPEQTVKPAQVADFFKSVQQQDFDLAIQMQGSGIYSNPVVELFGAKQSAGFYENGCYCPDPKTFLPIKESENEIKKYLRLMKFLGLKPQGEYLEFPISLEEQKNAEWLLKRIFLHPDKLVCLNPGARDVRRRWPARYFAAIADHLSRQGYEIALTGSPEDRPVNKEVARLMMYPAVNLAGLLGLGEFGALLKTSRLLITNDTGASHLAAALAIKSLVIFSRFSEPRRWAPLNRELHLAFRPEQALDVTAVLKEALTLLGQPAAGRPTGPEPPIIISKDISYAPEP